MSESVTLRTIYLSMYIINGIMQMKVILEFSKKTCSRIGFNHENLVKFRNWILKS